MGRWPDPISVTCPSCGRKSPIPLADLRSLQAICPECNGSLTHVGEQFLAKEAWLRKEIDQAVAKVWAELDAEEMERSQTVKTPPGESPADFNAKEE